MENPCPNCGWFPEFPEEDEPTTADEFNWMYSPTSHENRMEALKKSEARMKEELGYGVPEEPDLGSCITGVWKENYETKKR